MTEPVKSAPQPPTQAAVVNVGVSFREVSAMFELHRGRRLVDDKNGPALIYDLSRLDNTIGLGGRYRSGIAAGQSSATRGMPGVHQFVEIEGVGNGAMTFSRAHAQSIAGKWIYMFVSTDAAGNGMKLEQELYADADQVQFVDLVANKGKDERAPSGTKFSTYQVEVISITRTRRWVWFLLAPYQIAWARLTQMTASGPRLASRCQRLFDELWTDGLDGTTPKLLAELGSAINSNAQMSFRMYLLDPLAEGARRASWYTFMHDGWQKEATRLAADEEYRLAKRIHALPADYANSVWHKLSGYLATMEKDVRPLLAIATARLEDLLWWIGKPRRRTDSAFDGMNVSGDTFYVWTDKVGAVRERKADRERYNAFSETVADYNHPDTPDEIALEVGRICSMVHARLSSLPDGQEFLAKIMRVALDGKLPLADAGAAMLFESKRKSAATGAEIASGLLEHYASTWVATYRSDTLPTLIAFAKKRLAIDLHKRHPHDVARALISVDRSAASKAANRPAKGSLERVANHYRVEVDPAQVRGLNLTKAAFDRLSLAFELFNLGVSFQAMREEKDPWAAVGLLGSALDAYSAVAEIQPKLETLKFTIGKKDVTWAIGTKLSMLSSAIDVVLGARDAIKATDPTVKAGHVMRTIGAYLSLGGTIFRATPAGVLMTVVGVALQALGSAIASGTDKLALFLAFSRWGTPPKVMLGAASQLDGDEIGYPGKLGDLSRDITAQHRALDWLMYRFEPAVRVFESTLPDLPSRVLLRMNPPANLGPDAKWKVDVTIVAQDDGTVLKRWEHLETSSAKEHVSLTSNGEISLVSHAPQREHTSMSARWGKVRVKGTLELDVFGDGKSMVTRKIDKKLDLPF